MKRYRERPREVEAVRFTNLETDKIKEWLGSDFIRVVKEERRLSCLLFKAQASGGVTCAATEGDWIVKGPMGFCTISNYSFEAGFDEIERP